MPEPGTSGVTDDALTARRARILAIAQLWERQLGKLEAAAFTHFQDQDLAKIAELISRKRALERRVESVRRLLEKP